MAMTVIHVTSTYQLLKALCSTNTCRACADDQDIDIDGEQSPLSILSISISSLWKKDSKVKRGSLNTHIGWLLPMVCKSCPV